MFKTLVEMQQVQKLITILATLLLQQELGVQQELGWEVQYLQALPQQMLPLLIMLRVQQEQQMLVN